MRSGLVGRTQCVRVRERVVARKRSICLAVEVGLCGDRTSAEAGEFVDIDGAGPASCRRPAGRPGAGDRKVDDFPVEVIPERARKRPKAISTAAPLGISATISLRAVERRAPSSA